MRTVKYQHTDYCYHHKHLSPKDYQKETYYIQVKQVTPIIGQPLTLGYSQLEEPDYRGAFWIKYNDLSSDVIIKNTRNTTLKT